MATEEEPRDDRSVVENGQASDGRAWDYLLQTWRELDVPEGWRAEIDERQIVLVPPPHAHHNGIAAKNQRRLYATLPEDLEIYQTLGIHIAPLGKLYVPDLVVMPAELIAAAAPETSDPMDASEALLVVEITSRGNAREDRTKKYRAYARAGVPMYLLIDRFDTRGPMATLFTEPNGDGTYKHTDAVPFGKSLTLPSPFDVELPTGEFPGAI
ncbi:restriction endonuclease [Streptomyces sp. NRRL F-2295]|uniref:Uma2 family endonuclease n=1 Tax=Streptomyces sp. NRRL F-2295 TaxID=1519477 RepID=UPI0006ADDD1F|nr:Uma2 family endonuclease [Streptomyces sp. NRRL F-2295]KOU00873.1 restriction endonuclease [Streptomyces sp. NRRL F-2295]